MKPIYKLYYWPMLPGRGEFIRLLLEDVGVGYIDIGRLPEDQNGGIAALQNCLQNSPSFALPILEVGELKISQMPNICLFLATKLGLVPGDENHWLANQLILTIADIINEVHNTHHPLDSGLYYEDQTEAAKISAAKFLRNRLPRWLNYFEKLLQQNSGRYLLGEEVCYVDIALFQLMRGLHYAFPENMQINDPSIPGLLQLCESIAARPGIAAYLNSDRCIAFNANGIFRAYPELDII